MLACGRSNCAMSDAFHLVFCFHEQTASGFPLSHPTRFWSDVNSRSCLLHLCVLESGRGHCARASEIHFLFSDMAKRPVPFRCHIHHEFFPDMRANSCLLHIFVVVSGRGSCKRSGELILYFTTMTKRPAASRL